MSKKKQTNWASLLGGALAHVQDGIDYAVDGGFKLLKKAGSGKDKPLKKDENKYVHAAKTFGKRGIKFIGMVGDEYYKRYEKLKSEKDKAK